MCSCVCAVCVTNYEALNECLFVKSARARQEEVGKKTTATTNRLDLLNGPSGAQGDVLLGVCVCLHFILNI